MPIFQKLQKNGTLKLARPITCVPVLDVFSHDKKVGLDKSLNNLTVPLLPSRQLPGHWNRLAMKMHKIGLLVCQLGCNQGNITINNSKNKNETIRIIAM